MKIKKINLSKLNQLYKHPSAYFFRAVELTTTYLNFNKIVFKHPSVDLGCGDGAVANLVFDENFTYGVDNNEANDVKKSIMSGRYQKVLIESAENLSLKSHSVNFVYSNCVIEHIPNNDKVLSEVSRILRDDGLFLFTVPSHMFPEYLYLTNKFLSFGLSFFSKMYKYRRNKMLNHFHCYSIDDWNDRLSRYSLKIINSKYYMSKRGLMLWDKMALKCFLFKLFGLNNEEKIFNKNFKMINEIISEKNFSNPGAGIIILCRKYKK